MARLLAIIVITIPTARVSSRSRLVQLWSITLGFGTYHCIIYSCCNVRSNTAVTKADIGTIAILLEIIVLWRVS